VNDKLKPTTDIVGVDLYCGAGGSSRGLHNACQRLGRRLVLTAINHWDVAIATHELNIPEAQHLCTSIDSVDPRKVVPGGRLNILWASPECIHFSVARGGRPVNDQSRASAWHVLRWAEALRIDNIIIENVKEFRTWGPIGADGRPLKSKRGTTYRAFLDALRSLNYTVEDRLLNAADFGDPTTRERLFIIAKRGRKAIAWPEPSHTASDNPRLFGKRAKWRAAREIIDWEIPGQSIFTRKRPLAATTIRRIVAGLEKFGGKELQPFLVVLRNNADARSIERPLPTLTSGGNHVAICEPFILAHRQFDEDCVDSIERPLRTVTAKGGGDFALARPFLVPFFGERDGQAPRTHSVDEPLPAVTSHGAGAMVQPVIVPLNHGHKDIRSYSVERPMPTVTTVDAWALVNPYIAKYNGTATARPVTEPLDTVTTKDRFALVMPIVNGMALDIHFRMLQPRELARAMGFEDDYVFQGNREAVVKQIGNAVAVNTAQALCEAVLG